MATEAESLFSEADDPSDITGVSDTNVMQKAKVPNTIVRLEKEEDGDGMLGGLGVGGGTQTAFGVTKRDERSGTIIETTDGEEIDLSKQDVLTGWEATHTMVHPDVEKEREAQAEQRRQEKQAIADDLAGAYRAEDAESAGVEDVPDDVPPVVAEKLQRGEFGDTEFEGEVVDADEVDDPFTVEFPDDTVVEMPAEDSLQIQAEIWKQGLQQGGSASKSDWVKDILPSQVDELVEVFDGEQAPEGDGVPLPLVVIGSDGRPTSIQEGRHRSIAAVLSEETDDIPVRIRYDDSSTGAFGDTVPEADATDSDDASDGQTTNTRRYRARQNETWEPDLHPRDPDTGKFVERSFDIPGDESALLDVSSESMLGYLDNNGAPIDSVLDPNSAVTVEDVPRNLDSPDNIDGIGDLESMFTDEPDDGDDNQDDADADVDPLIPTSDTPADEMPSGTELADSVREISDQTSKFDAGPSPSERIGDLIQTVTGLETDFSSLDPQQAREVGIAVGEFQEEFGALPTRLQSIKGDLKQPVIDYHRSEDNAMPIASHVSNEDFDPEIDEGSGIQISNTKMTGPRVENLNDDGYIVSRQVRDLIVHEMAHAVHLERAENGDATGYDDKNLVDISELPSLQSRIDEVVSTYGSTISPEFVAEMYVKQFRGEADEIPVDITDFYETLMGRPLEDESVAEETATTNVVRQTSAAIRTLKRWVHSQSGTDGNGNGNGNGIDTRGTTGRSFDTAYPADAESELRDDLPPALVGESPLATADVEPSDDARDAARETAQAIARERSDIDAGVPTEETTNSPMTLNRERYRYNAPKYAKQRAVKLGLGPTYHVTRYNGDIYYRPGNSNAELSQAVTRQNTRQNARPREVIRSVPVFPDALQEITRAWLTRWVHWVQAGRPEVTPVDDREMEGEPRARQEMRRNAEDTGDGWVPELHPRDPDTGKFVESTFEFADDWRAVTDLTTKEMLQFLQDNDADVRGILDPNSVITIEGAPRSAATIDDIPDANPQSDITGDGEDSGGSGNGSDIVDGGGGGSTDTDTETDSDSDSTSTPAPTPADGPTGNNLIGVIDDIDDSELADERKVIEIEKTADAATPADTTVRYENFNPRQAAEVTRAIGVIQEREDELPSQIDEIRSDLPSGAKPDDYDGNPVASYGPPNFYNDAVDDEGRFAVMFNAEDNFQRSALLGSDAGYKLFSSRLRDAALHEFAHAVHHMREMNTGPRGAAGIVEPVKFDRVLDDVGDDIQNGISDYAATSSDDFVAEAYVKELLIGYIDDGTVVDEQQTETPVNEPGETYNLQHYLDSFLGREL
jgi:hypothetical protein